MDWLKKLIEKHTKDGVVDQEELIKEVNIEFPKHAVPKETYNTLATTKVKLENDIKDRDKQLEGLKEIDAEGLQAEIIRLQGENTKAKDDYEKELKDLQIINAINFALNGKVHDEDLVAGLVDKEKIIIGNDGKIVGLDEQITSLQESKAFLFKEKETNPTDLFSFKGVNPADSREKDKPEQSLGEQLAAMRNSDTKIEDPWG